MGAKITYSGESMDVQLNELIAKIKSEGVKNAEKEAASIIKQAEKKADEILAAAEKKASAHLAEAKAESSRFEQTARESLKQASRDVLLTLKERIIGLFEAVILQETREALSEKTLEEAIVSMIKAWKPSELAGLELLLSPEDLAGVEKKLRAALAAEFKKGVEIKPSARVQAGFQIGEKDGAAYYNFTDQGIAEILSDYLNPKIAECVNEAIQKES
jgi:V/A-type H+-transporting ATPase subunit E